MPAGSAKTYPLNHVSLPNTSPNTFHNSLLVDEIEIMPPKTMASSEPSLIKGFVHSPRGIADPLGSKHNTKACPCCQRYVAGGCIGDECGDVLIRSVPGDTKDADEESTLFGSLGTGIDYEIKEELFCGWVHKKGSGRDWLSSRAWKSRYASLVLASVPGYETDVPLLLLYWHPQVPTPTTIIILDSTIIIAVERDDEEDDHSQTESCYTHCFDVVHTRGPSDKDKEDKITRTFSVPLKERNEWVFAIRRALIRYGKRKVLMERRKAQNPSNADLSNGSRRAFTGKNRMSSLPPISPPRARPYETTGQVTSLPPVSPQRMRRSTTPQRVRKYSS